jgi:N-acetylneuraminic acid mutarotase
MLIIGGTKDRPGLPNGKRYDPVADRWREIATNSLARGRSGHTAIADGSGVFVFGGGENSVWRYDVVADSWSNIPEDNGPKAFYGASITKVGNEVVVWGGYDFRTVRADGARLDLASMSWKPLSSFVPHGNDKPTAVWTGEAFFVSAGSFGVFDLSRRSWLETDVAGGQGGGSFIWAGTMALLWGGRTGPDFGLQYHNGGWELAPDGVPLGYFAAPGVIPPSGRAFHSAIWTGSEMIVWGGKNSRRLFADGAKWSASTRSWAPIQANNAPSARINHSAVWTGASMIIWGGETDAESSLTGITVGGIYSPDSDSWEILGGPLSTVGHTAVWTGSEMLVWGGIKAGTPPVVSGNAYRPHGRLWHRLPLDSASTAVQGHSAVWTGKEMIVWGGLNSRGEPLGEGARYNPSQGRWYPMPLSSPSPRANHAAAWTGDRMLIWGGSGGGSFGDTWEYLPPGDAEPTSDLITLRWSVTAEQHRLQFTPSLTEPDWRDVPDSPTQTNSVWTVTLPAPMSSGAAFRLIAE